jgi:hypothetical protein
MTIEYDYYPHGVAVVVRDGDYLVTTRTIGERQPGFVLMPLSEVAELRRLARSFAKDIATEHGLKRGMITRNPQLRQKHAR